MNAELKQSAANRRKIVRQKSLLRGMIYFNNRQSVLDCTIRDFSPNGARLVFSNSATTPDVLDLYIPQKDRTLRAHVVWRHDDGVGVAFAQIAELESPADVTKLAERVIRLETEVATLRRALKKLQSNSVHEFELD
jgi:hypothetical protein